MSLLESHIDISAADPDDIEDCLEEVEELKEKYPDAYSIASLFEADELRKALEARQ